MGTFTYHGTTVNGMHEIFVRQAQLFDQAILPFLLNTQKFTPEEAQTARNKHLQPFLDGSMKHASLSDQAMRLLEVARIVLPHLSFQHNGEDYLRALEALTQSPNEEEARSQVYAISNPAVPSTMTALELIVDSIHEITLAAADSHDDQSLLSCHGTPRQAISYNEATKWARFSELKETKGSDQTRTTSSPSSHCDSHGDSIRDHFARLADMEQQRQRQRQRFPVAMKPIAMPNEGSGIAHVRAPFIQENRMMNIKTVGKGRNKQAILRDIREEEERRRRDAEGHTLASLNSDMFSCRPSLSPSDTLEFPVPSIEVLEKQQVGKSSTLDCIVGKLDDNDEMEETRELTSKILESVIPVAIRVLWGEDEQREFLRHATAAEASRVSAEEEAARVAVAEEEAARVADEESTQFQIAKTQSSTRVE